MYSPKDLSDFLARFPTLRHWAAKIYGFRPFHPERHLYTSNSDYNSKPDFENQPYEMIFDAQCLQTPTRLRGIGRYAINFMVAYSKSMPTARFLAVFTNVADTVELESAIEELNRVAPDNLEIQVLDIFQGASKINLENAQQNLITMLVLSNCKKILIFDGFEKLNNRVPIGKANNYKRIEILHDLIKQKFPNSLLPSNYDKSLYSYLFEDYLKVDLVLSNSKSTASDWFSETGSSSPVIFGASALREKELGLPLSERSGVLIIGAEQPHKNVERAMSAYSMLPKEFRDQHKLTVVGIRATGFQNYLRKKFKPFLPSISFAANVSDSILKENYRKNRLVIMPSLAEGLGLPILESWNFGTVAIGASGTVAEEILSDPELMFDPMIAESIASVMERFLSNDPSWIGAQQHLLQLREKFSWDETVFLAKSAIGALDA